MQQDTTLPKIQHQLPGDSVQDQEVKVLQKDTSQAVIDTASKKTGKSTVNVDSQAVKTVKPQTTSIEVKPAKQHFTALPDSLVEKPIAITPDPYGRDDTSATVAEVQQAPFIPAESLRPKNSSIWEISVLLFSLLLIAAVKALNKRRFGLLIKSFFNSRVVPQNLREENAFSNQVIIVLTGTFVLVVAAMIYQVLLLWIPEIVENNFRFYAQICLFIVLVYITKFALLELLAEVADKYQAIQEYIFNVLLFNSIVGLVLLPIVLGNALTLELDRILLTLGLVLVIGAYLYRNWRAIKISLVYRFPVYYIFLYLCTLEILPSIVLIKLFQTQLT